MATQQYLNFNFRDDTLALIHVINRIVEDYIRQGYVLTVRQLYYQLVSRDIVPNTEKSYKRITSVVNDARLAGLTDWDAIEDRTRSFIRRPNWADGAELLNACAKQFHMDMWENQTNRVFVIVEKEALAGVLERVCREFDIPLLAARGYPSGTVLREFVEFDVIPAIERGEQHVQILHLGDHDPSGIDMTRDLRERIELFAGDYASGVELQRIALTMDQINDQRPPPNPAKTTDARFVEYRRKFGNESWELDALSPQYLNDLVRTHVEPFIEYDSWEEKKAEIKDIRDRISKVAQQF